MAAYRLDIAYDGAGFSGFQTQKNGHTIQDHLHKSARRILPESVNIVGSSRTDAGVSAYQQLCILHTATALSPPSFSRSMNALLPRSIRLYHMEPVPEGTHPLKISIGKIYRYRLWQGPCLDPFASPRVWEIPQGFAIDTFEAELHKAQGEHDFTSLANTGSAVQSPIRRIDEIKVISKPPAVEVWIHGNGFLRQMVRNLVGTCLTLSLNSLNSLNSASFNSTSLQSTSPKPLEARPCLRSILASKDRTCAFRAAPAPPLTLMRCLIAGEESTIAEEIEAGPWNARARTHTSRRT